MAKATIYSVADRVAHLQLSRPHRRNAWTGSMHAEYRAALAEAESDEGVRAIVVSGDPEGRAFCVGGDAEALAGHVDRGGYDPGTGPGLAKPGYGVSPEFDHDFAFQMGMTKPIVAAVNGAAAGVGLAVMCFADIRIVDRSAKLTTAHGKLGLPVEYGMSWLLPRLVGLTRAADLVLTSRVFTGADALAWDLALEAAPNPAACVERALEYATELAFTVSPSSLAASKRQLYLDQHRGVGASVAESNRLLAEMMTGPEFAEGVAALREKRPPEF